MLHRGTSKGRRLSLGLGAMVLFIVLGGCDAVGLGGEDCHHGETGEVLKQVRDANGDLFPVVKADTGLTLLGLDLVFCGVSIEARLGGERSFNYAGFVYHPETGEPIEASGGHQGLRSIGEFEYEWY